MNKIKIAEDFDVCIMYRCMILSLYTYNHTGERSLKRYGAFNTAYLNGAYAGSGLDGLTRYSAYVSPYYVEHGTGTNASTTTKHYYIGTERLVSKLVTSENKKDDVKEKEDTYYYFTDHLGSTTHITDKGGKVVQYAAYTPYGTLFREYKSVMPYKFNGKELDQETGYYYYGARYYDPSAALWLGVDPMQHKYPEVSPYVYCHGNPVVRIDPDGRDDYDVDNNGNIVNVVKNENHDTFSIVDNSGNKIDDKQITFEYGTIKNHIKVSTGNKDNPYFDRFDVKGDENGKKLFEFLADNTSVEWSHFATGSAGEKGNNYISTSHEETKERSFCHFYNNQFKSYSLRFIVHNHPSGNNAPSVQDKEYFKFIKQSAMYFHVNVPKISIYSKSAEPKYNEYISH